MKGNEYVPQMVDKESAIIIRTDKKTYFSVQLFCRFTEEGFYNKSLFVRGTERSV